ncbi:MAG: hypothetical protein KDD53_12645, partial [Bdellovibrionales bacterium]|nr:hypothetical protein [Bdellovibrionales bacterium]
MNKSLSLIGRADAFTKQEQPSYGVDLNYTILASKNDFLNIEILGNHKFKNSELLSTLRLTSESRITPSQTDTLKAALETFYRDRGLVNSKVQATCNAKGDFCVKLQFEVEEGQESRIRSILFEGDPLEPILPTETGRVLGHVGDTASKQLLNETVSYLTQRLRNEGYISARVKAEYLPIQGTADRNLLIKSDIGNPTSFIFHGNEVFTPEQFLETIRLFTRKQPFGRNTINILLENIERMYRREGYLYVAIGSQVRMDEDTNRTTYIVNIDEGPLVPVLSVDFVGLQAFSVSDLRKLIADIEPSAVANIFSPKYAVAEELEYNSETIRKT